ncbi:AAA family ATPase [Endozoicomonas gorgoniicola]|uniref:AAA family ATPase n=1 Tax=Endozoicomonas gorgoniicola TaxID=1234144 RepID=A0ABT3MP20_9GAMM|nr:AAA family ATPase [Endozoicomonas gorgoniicola]MCW7551125.1 AAA family ATPase [Endozoicomonas gorgoniicola]
METLPYLREISLKSEKIEHWNHYPFTIPAIRSIDHLPFSPEVTFFIGENGSGKSTLLEAIAVAMGFNPEGGTKNFNFGTRESHSALHQFLRLVKSIRKPADGFFLRAESFFNVATNIEQLDNEGGGPPIIDAYGGISLHEQSHGESFLSLVLNRFRGNGLYILDEPEAALSPARQLTVLSRMNQLVQKKSQFIIATHSPLLMAYPGALIYHFTGSGIESVNYEETEHYQITRSFLANPDRMLRELFEDD